jgi:hypothetical protein
MDFLGVLRICSLITSASVSDSICSADSSLISGSVRLSGSGCLGGIAGGLAGGFAGGLAGGFAGGLAGGFAGGFDVGF